MILYKFLNGDKTASAKYITDAFYDVNELKSLRQFYVTELREVSPEIVQAGVNIEVGMYNEVDFINMAKIAQLTLEKWSDNTFLGTLVSVPEDENMEITSPTDPVEYGDDIEFEWTAVENASFYEIFVYPETKPVNYTSPTLTVINGPVSMKNTFLPGKLNFFFLVTMEDGSTKKSQVLSFESKAPVVNATPAAAATGVASPVNLEWGAVDGATDYSVYVVEATKDFIPNEFNKTTSNQLSIALGTGVKYKWMVMANIGNSSMVIVPSREFTVA